MGHGQAAGHDLAGLTVDRASTFVRGPEGTKVQLVIQRGDEKLTRDVERAVVSAPVVASKMRTAKDGTKVAQVALAQFSRGAADQVRKEVDKRLKQGAKGILLDLRGNGGGLLDEARLVASIFIPDGKIVTIKGRNQPTKTLTATGDAISAKIPVAVLVFLMVMTYFAVPEEQRQRVLVIGILGAIVLRSILIFAGAALLAKFHWLLYLFGAFLLLTGIKMWFAAGKEPDLEKNPALRWMRNHLKLTDGYRGDKLSVRENGVRWFTPMFVVLVLIGVTDVIFAVDSIPAVLGVTQDPFIVFSSNLFAILGLRSLYFAISAAIERFKYLPHALCVILAFVGGKMLVASWIEIPILVSLGVIILSLSIALIANFFRPKS